MQKYLFIGLCLLLTIACQSQEGELLQIFEEIKELGNSDPQQALEQLDSLSLDIEGQSVYVRAKYELLRVRLSDKAYIMPSTDKTIKELVAYFDSYGTDSEKLEVHFYAGSVYRDLQDTPHALEHFLRSMDIAEKTEGNDYIMLRNTYSNLCFLFGWEHDNENCLLYAQKEYDTTLALGQSSVQSVMHMGEALFACDSVEAAIPYFDRALSILEKTMPIDKARVFRLLYLYSHSRKLDKADKCIDLLAPTEDCKSMNTQELFALAEYYRVIGNASKAIFYNQHILDSDEDLISQYDAARYLFLLHRDIGSNTEALEYGDMFIDICGELNLGGRQELAATVNNLYKYQRDKDEEQRVYDESQRNQRLAIGSVACIILLVIIGILVHVIHKNKHLQKVLMLTGELSSIKDAQKKLLLEVEQLKQQNENYDRLLHQVELQSKSSDIFNSLQQATIGLHKMNPDEWQQFYQVVDQQYPDFKKKMLAHLGSFSEKQMQFCYLLRMGFSKPEIENITDLTHVTVWRWEKKYGWIVKESGADK